MEFLEYSKRVVFVRIWIENSHRVEKIIKSGSLFLFMQVLKANRTFHVEVKVNASYDVKMTTDVFASDNKILIDHITDKKVLFVVDSGIGKVAIAKIKNYITHHRIEANVMIVESGEKVKNGLACALKVIQEADKLGLDRKELMVLVGGGAVLDMAGFAASIIHRGMAHIRIPTTLLSQIDGGVGTKNSVNFFGQKNFIGAFFPAKIVIVDPLFLKTVDDRQIRSGMAEMVKVALIKDCKLFELIEEHYLDVLNRDDSATSHLREIMWRTIIAHLDQISIDPYERNFARPLDYGHEWGHRLETFTNYRLLHGEGVSLGIAIDTFISYQRGLISQADLKRTLQVLENINLPIYDSVLTLKNIWPGLESFRRHLGGELTISLLKNIGEKNDVHDIKQAEVQAAIDYLKERVQLIL